MALSIQQLLTPVSKAECFQTLTEQLDALGFTASSWQSGSIQRTMLEVFATVWSDLTHAVKVLTEAGFNELASGDLLTEFSKSHYDNHRIEAVRTLGPLRLTTAAGAGPHPIALGAIVVADATNGYTYRNVTTGTLVGGTDNDTIIFEAEVAGQARNVAPGTITVLQTALAGVTVNNPIISGSTWYTTAGVDEESDAKLRQRNRTKWASLSIAVPKDGLINIVLGIAGIGRADVDDQNPLGPGTAIVYVAANDGAAAPADVTAAQTAVDAKKAVSSQITVEAAGTQNQAFSGTIYIDGALNTPAKQTEVKNAIKGFVDALPIGGVNFPPLIQNEMPLSELLDVITSVIGVRKVDMANPTTNVAIAVWNILTTDTGASMAGLTFTSI